MRSTPRVTILSLHYPPEPTGNAPYTGAFARGLKDRDIPVCVLTAHPHYPEWKFRNGYGQWTRRETLDNVCVTRMRHYLPHAPRGTKRLLSELSFGVRLFFARWGAPDVIVVVSPALFSAALAMVRARLSWRPPVVILWVQDLYSLGVRETGAGGATVARLMAWVESKIMRAATIVVVIHPRFSTYLSENLHVDPARIEVVRNWTHLESMPSPDIAAVRKRHGWPDGDTVVVHAGNMGAKQGLENVVDAARIADEKQLPLRFVLLGDGNQRAILEKYAHGVGRLEFLDPLSAEDFQAVLVSADVLLVNEKPGVSEMSVPSKLTSYFGSGRPVVAAADPGGVTAAEVLAAAAGAVVRAGDPRHLVDACMDIRANPEEAARFAANGKTYRRDVLGQAAAIDRFSLLISKAHRREPSRL